jgi:DNA-binding SARP family transcriptional activator
MLARRKLTGLLNHLNRSLPMPDLVITEDDCAWLNPSRTWVDTIAFGQLGAQSDTLDQAVDLYQGPFLDAVSLPDSPELEMWALQERQAWEHQYLETLAQIIDDHAAQGNHEAAIAYARRYLQADELAESIHVRLIELYARTGDRGAALRQFERCTAILEGELGVRPLPATEAVYQAVLNSEPLPKAVLDAGPRWTVLPSTSVHMVGRQTALQQLHQSFHQALAGHGGAVLISGEPGMGKSRLMQEFTAQLRTEALVLVGTGFPDTRTTPYQPIVDALRPALREHNAWHQIPHHYLADATHLLPELRAIYPDLVAPSGGEEDPLRTRLFEALCKLTLALAAGPHPLLLCLDDLHWADPTTLDWLAYLARRIMNHRLLLLGTYRIEESDTVAEFRHNLVRAGRVTELALNGLDESATLQIIRSLHGARAIRGDRAAARQLTAVTGGNPFFLLETLHCLTEAGLSIEALSSLETLPLPDTIMDVVETRLKSLSPTARQVLEAGAVLGPTFTFDSVRRTSGRREMEMLDALDELTGRHLLVEEPPQFRFRHVLIQMAVVRGLGYWRRRILHQRAGETLEELQPGNAAALARHFAKAEQPGRAARHALKAGQAAKAVFAHVEARRHFDQALVLLHREATELHDPDALAANQALQVQVLHERGWALRLLGDMEAYAQDLEQVACLAHALQDPRTTAHLRWRQAYTHRWFCRYTQARQAAEEGLRLSQQENALLLEALCGREIGMAAREAGDYESARTALERSLGLFTRLEETVYRIHTLGNLATLHWYLGEYALSRDLALQALSICDQEGLAHQRRLPLGDLGAAAAALGDAELARSYLEESLSIARATGDRTQEILCLLHLGWLQIRQEQPAGALSDLKAGLVLAEQIGSCTEQSCLLCGLAEAHRLQGRYRQAWAYAQRALQMARDTERPYDCSLACRILDRLEQTSRDESRNHPI